MGERRLPAKPGPPVDAFLNEHALSACGLRATAPLTTYSHAWLKRSSWRQSNLSFQRRCEKADRTGTSLSQPTGSVAAFVFLLVGLLFPAALTFTFAVGRIRGLRCSVLLGSSRGALRMLVVMRCRRWWL